MFIVPSTSIIYGRRVTKPENDGWPLSVGFCRQGLRKSLACVPSARRSRSCMAALRQLLVLLLLVGAGHALPIQPDPPNPSTHPATTARVCGARAGGRHPSWDASHVFLLLTCAKATFVHPRWIAMHARLAYTARPVSTNYRIHQHSKKEPSVRCTDL